MTRYIVTAVCLITLLMMLAVSASADPATVDPFIGRDFSDFGTSSPATSLLISPYNYGGTFVGNIYSQTFVLPGGEYLYLYQAANTGPSILELMGVAPISGFAEAGYLTEVPAGFLEGGKTPLNYGGVYAVMYDSDSKLLTFNYSSFFGAHLNAGEHSVALCVRSPFAPTLGEAYVIDGGVAAADVWIPVPEPSSMMVLLSGLAGLGMLKRRR